MIWNNLTFKKLVLLCAIFLLATAATIAQPQVDVKINVKGDTLYLDAHTTAPQPQLRMNPEPAFLELTFPKSALAGQPASTAVDKGLIRKVVTSTNEQDAVIRVYVLSKPKATLSKTDTGYRYVVKLSEMANAPSRPAPQATATQPEPTPPVAAQPAPEPPKPVAASKPKTASKPAPAQPAATPTKPAAAPSKPPAATATTAQPATRPPAAQPTETAPRTVAAPPVAAAAPAPKVVREYFPFKTKSAESWMKAAQLAFPNAKYVVDPVLNILMVEGTAQEIEELENFLRAQSPK